MTAERKYFSGNTLEIAIMQAARHHGLQPEEVAYRRIEKRHGFLKARKSVVIEVDPEAPALDPQASAVGEQVPVQEEPQEAAGEISEPVVESSPPPAPQPVEDVREEPREAAAGLSEDNEYLSAEPTEDLMEAARRGLQEILAFAKLDLEVQVEEGEGQLDIELNGPDRQRLVEDRGNLLLAIQHLLPRLIRGYTGRSIPCHVDSGDFHATREAELEKLALEAAQEVHEQQRSRTLPPMNPAERRIIHVTLADNDEVSTESQGKGFFKRVTIAPAMRRPRGFDRY